jgi:hypothetical protein
MDVGMAEAGQSCDEPIHREEEGRLHQDVLAETMAYGDQPLTDGTFDTVDQDATRAGWTTSRARGSHVGLVWHM